ncbi:MAG: hypothetical protein LBJ67_01335 [Planctomycetaceae bacterium]|nr:hypothetical protein [Planctomycetaceae bacterium]
MKISSSRSYQPQVHFVRKPSCIARRIRKKLAWNWTVRRFLRRFSQPRSPALLVL